MGGRPEVPPKANSRRTGRRDGSPRASVATKRSSRRSTASLRAAQVAGSPTRSVGLEPRQHLRRNPACLLPVGRVVRGGQAPRSRRTRTKASRTAWSRAPSSRGSMSRSPLPASWMPAVRRRNRNGQAAWVSRSVGLHCSGSASAKAASPAGRAPARAGEADPAEPGFAPLPLLPPTLDRIGGAQREVGMAGKGAARTVSRLPAPARRTAARSASSSPRASSRGGSAASGSSGAAARSRTWAASGAGPSRSTPRVHPTARTSVADASAHEPRNSASDCW